MSNLLVLFVIIFVATFGICQLLFAVKSKVQNKKYDGRLVIDEAADSWQVSIATDPEEIKKKKHIRLKVVKL